MAARPADINGSECAISTLIFQGCDISISSARSPSVSSAPHRSAADGFDRECHQPLTYTGLWVSCPTEPRSLHETSTRSLRVAVYAIVSSCSAGTDVLWSNLRSLPSGMVIYTATIRLHWVTTTEVKGCPGTVGA